MKIYGLGRSSFFDLDGTLQLWSLCYEFGHNYWRIPESPNGICEICGELAQNMLQRVSYLHLRKETWAELQAFGNCHSCGVKFTIKHIRCRKTTQDGLIFCSSRCRANHVWSIEADPNGTSEPPPIPWHFNNIMPFIVKRDKHRCRQCGAKETDMEHGSWESFSGTIHKVYRSNLEVHHIQFRSQGGSDHPANLITLCHDCHTNITREKFKKDRIDRKYKHIAKLEQFL